MKVNFTVPGEPTGKGRHRTANGVTYTPEKTKIYENLVKVEYERQCGNRKFPPDAMLDARITAYYEIPASASQKKKQMMRDHKYRPTKTPDCDNVMKAILDGLNGVAYKDDKQIVDCQVRKFYSDNPRVVVTIQEARII